MPAVVRIKRRIDEEPLSAFILNSKKRRRLEATEDGSADRSTEGAAALVGSEGAVGDDKDEVSTILKFAGTIQEQDDSATTQLARLTKEAAKELVLQKSMRPPSNHTERARQEMRQALHENRFRVVNCMRTTLDDADDASDAVKEVTIVDIEKQETNKSNSINNSSNGNGNGNGNVAEKCVDAMAGTSAAAAGALTQQAEHMEHQLAAQQSTDSDTGYVYDLYLPENELQAEYDDLMDDNYLSVRPYDDLIYEDKFNDEDEDCDSEDSNDENYYANDYPDEEEENDDEGQEYYMDSYDHEQINELEHGMGRLQMVGNTDGGFIHTFDPDDSSVSVSGDSSEDYYYENDDYGGKQSDEEDDDVDYYDASENSDDTKDEEE